MKYILAVIFTFLSLFSFSQTHNLAIIFKGVESSQGDIFVQLMSEEGEILSSHVIPARGEEEGTMMRVEVPSGRVAVKAFHDRNSNEKLDKNLVGAPKEPYGFSNNVRGTFGEPAMQDQLIMVDRDKRITITLK